MAPPARVERALTLSGVNPTWGPMIVVEAWSADMISALRTVDHSLSLKTAAMCVSLEVLCYSKCATWRLMAATVYARGCPVAPFPIDYTLTLFFCIVKKRLM